MPRYAPWRTFEALRYTIGSTGSRETTVHRSAISSADAMQRDKAYQNARYTHRCQLDRMCQTHSILVYDIGMLCVTGDTSRESWGVRRKKMVGINEKGVEQQEKQRAARIRRCSLRGWEWEKAGQE